MSGKQEYLPQTLKKERFERQHDLRSNKVMQLKRGRVRTWTQVYLSIKSESLTNT